MNWLTPRAIWPNMPLNTRVIGDYTVTEAGPIEAARSVNFAAKYQAMLNEAQAKGNDATEDDLERLQALSAWATFGACVSPRLSPDDWLAIPLTVIADIRQAAVTLNPTWFPDDSPAAEKKRSGRPKKYMKK